MTANESARKTATKKATAASVKKSAKKAAKKAAKKVAKKAVKKAAAKVAKKAATKKAAPKKQGISAQLVNLGHIFALRPRISKSFKPDELRQAKIHLKDELYASVEEAARAVVEKALESTNAPIGKHGFRRR